MFIESKIHLFEAIQEYTDIHGNACDLNHFDVSQIEDMSHLFKNSKFCGDISKWDTSNVLDMYSMFSHSQFNNDISKWDTSKVINMSQTFSYSKFKGDISSWSLRALSYSYLAFSDDHLSPLAIRSYLNQELELSKTCYWKQIYSRYLDIVQGLNLNINDSAKAMYVFIISELNDSSTINFQHF